VVRCSLVFSFYVAPLDFFETNSSSGITLGLFPPLDVENAFPLLVFGPPPPSESQSLFCGSTDNESCPCYRNFDFSPRNPNSRIFFLGPYFSYQRQTKCPLVRSRIPLSSPPDRCIFSLPFASRFPPIPIYVWATGECSLARHPSFPMIEPPFDLCPCRRKPSSPLDKCRAFFSPQLFLLSSILIGLFLGPSQHCC